MSIAEHAISCRPCFTVCPLFCTVVLWHIIINYFMFTVSCFFVEEVVVLWFSNMGTENYRLTADGGAEELESEAL